MIDDYFIYKEGEYEATYKKAYFNKTEEEINKSLQVLKDWIKKQAHLPQNEDEFVLKKMLMLNKFSIEKTKSKLETFYTGKTLMIDYFENCTPNSECIQRTMDQSIFLPMSTMTKNHHRVIVLKMIDRNARDINVLDYVRLMMLSIELRLQSTDICEGDIVLTDMEAVTLPVLTRITPRIMQNTFNYLVGAYTDRIISMNYINVPGYAQNLITVVKSFMKGKLAERVHVHKDLDSLYKIISKSELPEDYGGEQKSLAELQKDWRKYLESKEEVFIERGKMKSNEKLRIGEPVNSELFGLQGSFQTLVVD